MSRLSRLIYDIRDVLREVGDKSNEYEIRMSIDMVIEIERHLVDYLRSMSAEEREKDPFRGWTSAAWEETLKGNFWRGGGQEEFKKYAEDFLREQQDRQHYKYTYHRYEDFFEDTKKKKTSPEVKTWHEVLGVRETATDSEIEKSYRRLAMKLHPDRAGGDTKRFQEITVAYRTFKKSRGL